MTATEQALAMARVAVAAAADKKAQDIVVLDVSEQLVITDCFVIASAPNERQVQAIVEASRRSCGCTAPSRRAARASARAAGCCWTSSTSSCTSSTSEERGFYGLDRLWKDCPQHRLPRGAGRASGRRRVTLRRLVLLRHGQTDYNVEGRMQGHLDVRAH